VQEPPLHRHTFGRLLGFLRPYKLSLTVSILLAVLSQGAAIALPGCKNISATQRGTTPEFISHRLLTQFVLPTIHGEHAEPRAL
jgi:hypothetical protein